MTGWLGLAAVLLVLSLGPYLVWSNDAAELQQSPLPLPARSFARCPPPIAAAPRAAAASTAGVRMSRAGFPETPPRSAHRAAVITCYKLL